MYDCCGERTKQYKQCDALPDIDGVDVGSVREEEQVVL